MAFLDPTKSWPVLPGPAPDVDRVGMQFDALKFGDPIDAAQFLGRPDAFHWTNMLKKDCELRYSGKGLKLRFRDGKLDEITFDVAVASPSAPDGTRLTRQTDKAAIAQLFGDPDPGGSDDETLQIFHGHGVASDFNLDEDGRLSEWVIYPE
ncbi:MAG TPA: hypothetical protein VJ853_01585 [Thermoanaerobaculia bacterium]|nr:hypothetical protein [Thermoanaerobaculia bacterium]